MSARIKAEATRARVKKGVPWTGVREGAAGELQADSAFPQRARLEVMPRLMLREWGRVGACRDWWAS